MAKVTCHGAGLVSADADIKNAFTVFVEQGKISGISVAFEGNNQQKKTTNASNVLRLQSSGSSSFTQPNFT